MTSFSHCDFHLGDNLAHLHFLRRAAKARPADEFVHFAHECHIAQLREAVQDIPNIHLEPFEGHVAGSRDVWKNAGGFWERHPHRADYALFYLDWFRVLAAEMGLPPLFHWREDLLFDYPSIRDTVLPPVAPESFDVLVINSRPCSGQFRAYDSVDCMDGLIYSLAERWRVVVTQPTQVPGVPCTMDWGLSVTGVGRLSLNCPRIIGVATGPMWPTFNVWNRETVHKRIIGLDPEQIQFDESGRNIHVKDMAGMEEVMRAWSMI